ncbi:hypothetical protein [uncultured Chryseobacterium sp.]|uniref:hypothetical protein n=1 Tax=uncultured Chryseobacterium sp. TaxID=259322 RepID=UPI0025E0D92D|nr:hypothetical protein [uncultured Chryseobacterium sp.]
MISLEYAKGFIRTFGYLSGPGTDTTFDFDIMEIDKNSDVGRAIASQFGTDENCIAYINEINEGSLFTDVRQWLLGGELINRNLSDYRLNSESQSISGVLLNMSIKRNSLKLIIFNDEAYEKIGSRFEFFIIEGSDKDYIVYFIRK